MTVFNVARFLHSTLKKITKWNAFATWSSLLQKCSDCTQNDWQVMITLLSHNTSHSSPQIECNDGKGTWDKCLTTIACPTDLNLVFAPPITFGPRTSTMLILNNQLELVYGIAGLATLTKQHTILKLWNLVLPPKNHPKLPTIKFHKEGNFDYSPPGARIYVFFVMLENSCTDLSNKPTTTRFCGTKF